LTITANIIKFKGNGNAISQLTNN